MSLEETSSVDYILSNFYEELIQIRELRNKLEYDLDDEELEQAKELSTKYSPYLLSLMYLHSKKDKLSNMSFLEKTIGYTCVKCNTRLSLYKNPFKYRFCPVCGIRINFKGE